MKRNLLIVLVLVLIGAGFMYMNSNTDFFKGSLTSPPTYMSSGTSESNFSDVNSLAVPNDAHIIDKIDAQFLLVIRNLYQKLESSNDFEERDSLGIQIRELQSKRNDFRRELINIFNVEDFDSIRIKNVNGAYVPCSLEELNSSECKGFKDFGYDDEAIQRLLGLDPYQEYLSEIKSAIPGGYYN